MAHHDPGVFKDWILNTIDQLRRRKARPDLERICHFVERRYGIERAVTETHVEKLVDQGVVIKVVYKRGTSYRNAFKSRKHSFGSNILNSKSASRKIIEAVEGVIRARSENKQIKADDRDQTLTENSDDENGTLKIDENDEDGVSVRDIENWLNKVDDEDKTEPFLCPIRVIIQREVEAGRLYKLENGNYLPCEAEKTILPKPQLQKSVSVISKRGRPPKRKLPLGRSLSCGDVQSSSTRPESQVAPVPIMPPHLCDFCQQSADRNKNGQEEELLFCNNCNAKAHPSCMQYSPELAKRARNTAWQCIDCKTCCICSDPGEAQARRDRDSRQRQSQPPETEPPIEIAQTSRLPIISKDCMLFCDACDKGYHMMCHDPPVTDKPQGKWVCQECVLDGVDIDEIDDNNYTNLVDSTVRSTDSESVSSLRSRTNSEKDSRIYNHRESLSPPRKVVKEEKKAEEKFPYVGNWSTSDITTFFKQKGFEEQANAFEEQEIDGQSLLLLKRSDVLTGLTLKLGPALKIYNIVMKLQSQTSL